MSESSLTKKIRDYIQSRADARMEKFDKDSEKERQLVADDPAALAEKEMELAAKRAEEEARFRPSVWLTDAANRAKQISMVTHALKYTHTDAKGTSVLATVTETESNHPYVTTASLASPATDVVGNAAALDVAALLLLKGDDGETLVSQIAQDDTSALRPFAENDAQLAEWLSGFKAALADRELSSHKLAKQTYFPVEEDYHLISPLFASSLAQSLYERIAESRFSEAVKAARKARREGKYSETIIVDYPNTAVQSFGGTKPQNVSQLNTSRRGKSILLRSSPPVWATRDLPPMNTENAFWRNYARRSKVWQTARKLGVFLVNVSEKNNKHIRRHRENLVETLMEELLNYAGEIQSLRDHAGWSANSALPRAEQLWLDPLRDDQLFQEEREAGDWQAEVAHRFGAWLNHQLRKKKLDVKDTEHREWSSVFERKLSLFKENLEVMA